MKNVAFIPVRGGSKSIPLKNIKLLCGHPLVFWVIKAACESKYIETVYVATDSLEIERTVNDFHNLLSPNLFQKVEVIGRSKESATDTASTESVMLEFSQQYSFTNIALIQATSPLLTATDIDYGFKALFEENVDSVLSVVRQKRFCWECSTDGMALPINYDIFHRPRRQDVAGYLVENGAFYITSRERLLQSKNRISGNIKAVEMPDETYCEIDEPSDWNIIENIMKQRIKTQSHSIPAIKMFLTDCDGCLTDGGMYYSEYGDELKKFNTKDGMAFSMLRERGIITGIITGETVKLNESRAKKMKVDIFESGCNNKVKAIKEYGIKYGVDPQNICYVGDDINDLDVLNFVGFGCCPADAIEQVKDVAKYVSSVNGGKGVIREIAEKILGS